MKEYKNYRVGYGSRKEKTLSTRKCMCCGQDFPSEGIHNRVCRHCKLTPQWKDGNETGAIGLSQAPKGRSE